MNKQREAIYARRAAAMNSEDIGTQVIEMIDDVIEDIILSRADEKEPVATWDVAGMLDTCRRTFGVDIKLEDLTPSLDDVDKKFAQQLFDTIKERVHGRYAERRQKFGEENFCHLERIVVLQTIDKFWKEHLAHMDRLKEGIGLRGYGQKNPLHEYQREAFNLFSATLHSISTTTSQVLFLSEIVTQEELEELERREREEQRRLEQAARSVHEDLRHDSSESERPASDGLNRKQRRRRDQSTTDEGSSSTEQQPAKPKKVDRKTRNKVARKTKKK
jgi:preprotein translocase subunit SecA